MEIKVPIRFEGHVSVEIPDSVPKHLRQKLADIYALCRVTATADLRVDERPGCDKFVEAGGHEDDWHESFIYDVDLKGMVIRAKKGNDTRD